MRILSGRIISIAILVLSAFLPVFAQENRTSFTWLDRSERKMAGTLAARLSPSGDTRYRLDIQVEWFDADGNPLSDEKSKPFLCLSKYDLEVSGNQPVTFPNLPSALVFRAQENLILEVPPGYEGRINLTASLLYAFSKDDYDSGHSEMIDIRGSNRFVMDFQLIPPGKEETGQAGPAGKPGISPNSRSLSTARENYRSLSRRVDEFEGIKPGQTEEDEKVLSGFDGLTSGIENARMLVLPDSMPYDSFQLYRERFTRLSLRLLELRSAFIRESIAVAASNGNSVLAANLRNDSLRGEIRLRFEQPVRNQVDSLTALAHRQTLNAHAISASLQQSSESAGTVPDSLVAGHNLVIRDFQALKLLHDNLWQRYRIEIDGLVPVKEIELLHTSFLAGQNDLQAAIDLVDNSLAAVLDNGSSLPWYRTNRFIWISLIAMMVLLILALLWNSFRNRKLIRDNLLSADGSLNPVQPAEANGASSVFGNDLPGDYVALNYLEAIPEAPVGIMHLHLGAVKGVYVSVHNAILSKQPGEFGGYLFGNLYKLPGKGSHRMELYVEKVVDSQYLRSSIPNDIQARADLVAELEAIVGENRKYRLLGWYASCPENLPEIAEGLMKVHRTFFKEKWQVGILIDPSSETLQGACFLKRPSGYVEPLPDPAAFLKWEELYRIAMSPESGVRPGATGESADRADFASIGINSSWVDSIVSLVRFDRHVSEEISAAAAALAIPKDNYQVVGYLYGKVIAAGGADSQVAGYEVSVERFVEVRNETGPREIPGFTLVGWWGQAAVDPIGFMQNAADFHESLFPEPWQIGCLANASSGLFRIMTRKKSLVLNNNPIETEEYQISHILSR